MLFEPKELILADYSKDEYCYAAYVLYYADDHHQEITYKEAQERYKKKQAFFAYVRYLNGEKELVPLMDLHRFDVEIDDYVFYRLDSYSRYSIEDKAKVLSLNLPTSLQIAYMKNGKLQETTIGLGDFRVVRNNRNVNKR